MENLITVNTLFSVVFIVVDSSTVLGLDRAKYCVTFSSYQIYIILNMCQTLIIIKKISLGKRRFSSTPHYGPAL